MSNAQAIFLSPLKTAGFLHISHDIVTISLASFCWEKFHVTLIQFAMWTVS